ncbi:hypothetical protein DIS24_g6424 [Lasiodiplodia hormozganensis]|uniref:Fibronectin type-III domain-containing protein n=1 Tax=Lasiodiplodia hormozganensis TaxID=869390 RepID=A0AA39YDX1_9PEZI|nr:hypothetical protein DIS24_g6424 [Lasiodiplodia hormozganensis]
MPSPELIAHLPVRAAGMEPLDALASAPSLTALATCAALLWLVYRAWLVMVIKEDDLIKLLGLDVPAAPRVSLAGIKADGAVFHWEPAEPRSGIQAYQIKINGVFVEEVGPKDTSVNIANLKPATAYTLRVIAINHHNFHTQSEPLRFRTKPPSSDDFFDFAAYNRAVEIANDEEHEHDEKWWVEPKVTPCKGFLEPSSPLPTPSDMVRSHSNSTSHPRRATTGRRNSPANSSAYQQADDSADDAKPGETEALLQAEGDKLRSDISVTRKAIEEEEKGFRDQKEVFNTRHNELKDELARKTAASSELKKEVVNLEKENQRAQAKKAAEEKSLEKKLNERKKMQDDVQRFRAEMDDMAKEIERIGEQQVEYQKSSEQKAQELRDKYSEELQLIKTLEESVRETGIQNRILEEERKKFEGGEGDIDAELRAQWAEEERQWSDRIRGLQQRYQTAWAALQAADRAYNEAQNQLQILSSRAANQPQVFRPPPVLDVAPSRRASQRRRQHAGSVGQESFPAAPGFPVTTAPYNNNSISSISPTVTTSSPFFNFANGAVPISNRETSFSPAEIEMLTGGAPMSPNAGALLPSDLFSNETDRSADEGESDFKPDFDEDRNSSGSFGGAPDALAIPGLELGYNAVSGFSRHPSRRPSVQYGNASNGLGYEDVVEDNFEFAPVTRSPPQAPIGTRPPSQPQPTPATPPSGKLNPAAPVFKGLWSRSADKGKAENEKPEKSSRSKDKSKSKSDSFDGFTAEEPFPSATATTDFATSVSSTVPSFEAPESPVDGLANLDVSPTSMRKSRDGRASTVTSNAETASLSLSASWSPRASLDRSESRNTAESLTGTSAGKESWMSKLSRKGSSSKFQLPGFGSIGGGSKDKSSPASSFFSRSPRVDKDHNNDDHDDESTIGTEPPTPGFASGFASSFTNSAASSPYIGGNGERERTKEEKKADRSSGLSWSSLRRKKKSSEKAPSINESIASERGANEEDEKYESAEGLGVSGA